MLWDCAMKDRNNIMARTMIESEEPTIRLKIPPMALHARNLDIAGNPTRPTAAVNHHGSVITPLASESAR